MRSSNGWHVACTAFVLAIITSILFAVVVPHPVFSSGGACVGFAAFLVFYMFIIKWKAHVAQTSQYATEDEIEYFAELLHRQSRLPTRTPNEIAQQAMLNAGISTASRTMRLNDIGLLVYSGKSDPHIVRTKEVPIRATHLRPFLVLKWRREHSIEVQLRFELIAEPDELTFVSTSTQKIKMGKNFITSPNWYPLIEHAKQGDWKLQVSLADKVIARHWFSLHCPDYEVDNNFRRYVREDGEIDEWASWAINDAEIDTVSLKALIDERKYKPKVQ